MKQLATLPALLSLLPLSTYASVPRAVPSTIELRPNDFVKKIIGPRGWFGVGQTGSLSKSSFVELQLNLCNSGIAKCYTNGSSVPEGANLIYETGPNVVTVNEICSDGVETLQWHLGKAWPKDYTYSVFMPAIDKRTGAAYKCKNGKLYGGVVLGRVDKHKWAGIDAYGGKYASQDGGNEQRTFACAGAKGDHFACVTHLSASSDPVALDQCNALFKDAIPYLKSQSKSTTKTIVGADLNLEYDPDDPENVQNCVPTGWTRKGDCSVQHTVFTDDLKFASSTAYGLTYTDHPGWLLKLTVT